MRIEVTPEKTGEASRRLIEEEGVEDVLALNFASARNPGGGFLRGAKAHQRHRTLVLGAWGCGAFRNDPMEAAGAFAAALSALSGAFERVVFAVYERGGEGPNLRAFRERFGQRPS